MNRRQEESQVVRVWDEMQESGHLRNIPKMVYSVGLQCGVSHVEVLKELCKADRITKLREWEFGEDADAEDEELEKAKTEEGSNGRV